MAVASEDAQRWHAEGRAAWPDLELSLEAFERFVRERDGDDVAFGADLYLACACLQGTAMAIKSFERAFFSEVGRALAKRPDAPIQRADFEQALREKLFVEPAKLAQYTGRGPLRMWVRITVSRMLHNLATRAPPEAHLSETLMRELDAGGADPELQDMKHRYQAEFREAFAEAVDRLDVRDQLLLHQSLALGRTQAALAEAHDVHVNTIARWLRRARTALETQTRTALAARLRVPDAQLDSVLALIQSRFDLSLARLQRP